MSQKPNIIIFNPDQFRTDALAHMGNTAAVTPYLDQLSEEGVSFRNAFCQNPVCTPSRCSFMSGWYPHVRGHRTMHHMMHEGEPVLLEILKKQGYYVWWGGKNDLVPRERIQDVCSCKLEFPTDLEPYHGREYEARRGDPSGDNYYSFYGGKIETPSGQINRDGDWFVIQKAEEFLLSDKAQQPFCLYLPLQFPHPPYTVEEPWFSMINREKTKDRIPTPDDWNGKPSLLKGIYERLQMKNWTDDRFAELKATYLGMCARVDYQFGMLVNALKKAGLYDSTAIFVFSDHGDFTGDYGLVEKTQNTFEDCLTRVPFLIKPPKGIPCVPGIRDALVELVDFPATVFDLLDIQLPYSHFGRSLLPVLGGHDEHRDAVFCEGGRLKGEVHCMELDSASSRDPKGNYWPRVGLQSSENGEHTKAIMVRTKDYKYVYRLYEQDELYDLRQDPHECVNRINDPLMRDVAAKLQHRLLRFMVETADVVPHKIDAR